MKSRFILFIPAIICFALSFYLLTIPGTQLPKIEWMEKFHVDKLVHISMFLGVCFLFSFPLRNKDLKWILYISIAGLLYGIAMEFVQKYFIPFRSFDLDDMLADGIGCAINYWWWRRAAHRHKS